MFNLLFYCLHLQVKAKLSESDRKAIESAVEEALHWLEDHPAAETEEFEDKRKVRARDSRTTRNNGTTVPASTPRSAMQSARTSSSFHTLPRLSPIILCPQELEGKVMPLMTKLYSGSGGMPGGMPGGAGGMDEEDAGAGSSGPGPKIEEVDVSINEWP